MDLVFFSSVVFAVLPGGLFGVPVIFVLEMPGSFGGFETYVALICQGSPEVVYPTANTCSIIIIVTKTKTHPI